MTEYKFISWNLNGIRSSYKKGLIDIMKDLNADVYCFQETKAKKEQVDDDLLNIDNYFGYWNPAEEDGYSGVISYSKEEPISVSRGIGDERFENEGRILNLEYDNFYLFNVYFPNAGRGLKRLDFKIDFNKQFLNYAEGLREEKPIIICGDFNVAHKEKDLANPDSNTDNAGFTPEEREWFSKFLDAGYIDTFREFVDEGGNYTYWTYRYNAREKNIGWRLDYFVINKEIRENLLDSYRLEDIKGSDHCPIGAKFNF